jgi:hypothetical protein
MHRNHERAIHPIHPEKQMKANASRKDEGIQRQAYS